jgi:hypothetical protein
MPLLVRPAMELPFRTPVIAALSTFRASRRDEERVVRQHRVVAACGEMFFTSGGVWLALLVGWSTTL